MFPWGIIFFLFAIVAAFLGFVLLSGTSALIAKIILGGLVLLFIISLAKDWS